MTDDRSDLAAEYALGLLTGDELRQALQLDREDPAFRAQVAHWSGRLAPLFDEVEPVTAPNDAWTAIERHVRDPQGSDNVVSLQHKLQRWRAATAAMTAIAASLVMFILLRPVPQMLAPAPAPQAVSPTPLAAALADPKSGTKVVATWNAASRQLVLVVSGDLPADPRRSHQLWVIPSGGKPRSLGLLSADRQSHIKLADALATLLQQGATVAISVEPQGGSPTGAPTGPVVASGALTPA